MLSFYPHSTLAMFCSSVIIQLLLCTFLLKVRSDCICPKPSRTFQLTQGQVTSPPIVGGLPDLASLCLPDLVSLPCNPLLAQSGHASLLAVPSTRPHVPLQRLCPCFSPDTSTGALYIHALS